MSEPPNNRAKLPFNVVIAVLAVWFLARGKYVVGGLLLVVSVCTLWLISRGRNPWWMRSPFERRGPTDRS
jgi:hypothetical protein